MGKNHDMYHLKQNTTPPDDVDSPLTREELEKYASLLALAYPQPKKNIRDGVMAEIAAQRAAEAEKSGRKVPLLGKIGLRRDKIHGKTDLVCAFDEAADSAKIRKSRLKKIAGYSSVAACLALAAVTTIMFCRYVPKTVTSFRSMDDEKISDVMVESQSGEDDIMKYSGSNSYRAKSYSSSSQAEDAAIAEETGSDLYESKINNGYSLYSNKIMSPSGAEEMISDFADADEEEVDGSISSDEMVKAPAEAADSTVEKFAYAEKEAPAQDIVTSPRTDSVEGETGEADAAVEEVEAAEAVENEGDNTVESGEVPGGDEAGDKSELPSGGSGSMFYSAKPDGFSDSSGIDGQCLTDSTEDCTDGLLKMSTGLLDMGIVEDAPVPTDCPHSSAFMNSYHDIPKVFVNIVGRTTYNIWAKSVVEETGDECSVNIAEFYAHFSEVDSEFAEKFASAYNGDVSYYCDLPSLSLFEEGKYGEIEEYYLSGRDYGSAVSRYFEYEYKNGIIGRIGVSNYTAWLAKTGRTYLRDWTIEEIASAFGLDESELDEIRRETEEEFPYSMEYANE